MSNTMITLARPHFLCPCLSRMQYSCSIFYLSVCPCIPSSIHPPTVYVDLFCALYISNTFWHSLIIFGKYVGQVKQACLLQEWKLSLSSFLGYLPSWNWVLKSCTLYNSSTFWNSLMICGKYTGQIQ